MSNDYFNHSTNVISNGTRATAAQVNNIAYEVAVGLDKLPSEAHIKRGTINYAADTGSADLYAVSLPYAPASYTDGMEVVFKAANSNTGACSMNVNSLGVKSIKRADGTDPAASEIPAAKITTLRYNSTSSVFEIQNGAGYASSAAASATAASNSAAAALVSEGNASASETAAGLSEVAAAASAAAALVSENAAAASAALFPNVNASVTASDEELSLLTGRTGTVWTSTNDGAGSGLDADKVKGRYIFTGYITSAGVGTLPSGWSVTRDYAGGYTVTHGNGVTLRPMATCYNVSASTGDLVATVKDVGANSFHIVVYDISVGNSVDGAVSFIAFTVS